MRARHQSTGVYGWPGDRRLHIVRLFDARGRLTTSRFLTTVDTAGARTQVDLAAGQTAIVVKLPVTLESDRPVNVCVTRFENGELDLALNGQAAVTLQMVDAGPIQVTGAPARTDVEARILAVDVSGLVRVQVQRAGP